MSLPLLHAGRTNPGLSAALDLRFALDKSLTAYRGPTPSFSRASTGSYFDGSGVLRYANVNLLLQSEAFSTSPWSNLGLPTITTNTDISPDGKQTADTINDSSTGSFWGVSQTISVTSGATYTFSIYIKKTFVSPTNYPLIQIQVGASSYSALIFNTFNGSISVATGGSYVAPASYQSVEISGYWRVSITAVINTSSPQMQFYPAGSSDGSTISSAATGSAVVWGAQLEASSTVGTYCPTTSSANSAPRFNHTFNGTSWVSRGLLVEEQRSNISTYSEDFSNAVWTLSNVTISSNAVMAPDGNTTADAIVENSSNTDHIIYQSSAPTVSAGSKYVMSVFAKKGSRDWLFLGSASSAPFGSGTSAYFNLASGSVGALGPSINSATITDIGNGWYRCCIFLTAAASAVAYQCTGAANANGTLSYQGNGSTSVYIWGFQLELGAFPTSYITTTSASVTRSADVCQITGSDFSGFWNMAEGSFAVEYDRLAAVDSNFSSGYPRIATAVKTSDTSRAVTLFASQSPSGEAFFVQDGTVQAWFSAGSLASANVSTKLSTGYKANDFAASLNGAAVATDASGTIPSGIDRMDIGNEYGVTRFHNGHIARLRYYRKRLPNATLQLLSEPDPTLNLQFALNKSLTPVAGPTPSFSRASTGSYFDSTGTLKYANVNLLTYSEQFDNAAWTKGSTTIFSNSIISPDSSLSADSLLETATTAVHYTNRSTSAGTGIFTFSVFLKKLGRQYAVVAIDNGSAGRGYVFDLDNGLAIGQVDTGSTGQVAYVSHSISNAGNGWYRCAITANVLSGNPVVAIVTRLTSTTAWSESYAGDTSKGVYAWGAQLELGSSPTQYAKTEASTTAGPRFDHVYSGGQWVSRGLLLEEQRTNLALWSEDLSNGYWTKTNCSITADAIVSPDGNSNADLAEFSASGTAPRVFQTQSFSVTSGTSYTKSFFVKAGTQRWIQIVWSGGAHSARFANFDTLTMTFGTVSANVTTSVANVGNGWYRVSATSAATATALDYFWIYAVDSGTSGWASNSTSGGSVYVFGFQHEAGAFPTSYIGTTSSSVTRSADVCQITGTSFNWMWNQGEGSVVAEFSRPIIGTASGDSMVYIAAGTGAPSNVQNGGYVTSGNITAYGYDSAFTYNFNHGAQLANTAYKIATGIKLNDFASSLNGAVVLTDNSGTVGTNQRLMIGHLDWSAGNRLNGHIAQLIYYPARLTNAKLQQLST